ncbi:MAG: Ribosomal-protein-serine acetyltransferase, partial [uncultured Microvirga sp.]
CSTSGPSAPTNAPPGSRCGRAISPSTRPRWRPRLRTQPGRGCTTQPSRCMSSAHSWTAGWSASRTTFFTARPGAPAPTATCRTCSPPKPRVEGGPGGRSSRPWMRAPARPVRAGSTGSRMRAMRPRKNCTTRSRIGRASSSTAGFS